MPMREHIACLCVSILRADAGHRQNRSRNLGTDCQDEEVHQEAEGRLRSSAQPRKSFGLSSKDFVFIRERAAGQCVSKLMREHTGARAHC